MKFYQFVIIVGLLMLILSNIVDNHVMEVFFGNIACIAIGVGIGDMICGFFFTKGKE